MFSLVILVLFFSANIAAGHQQNHRGLSLDRRGHLAKRLPILNQRRATNTSKRCSKAKSASSVVKSASSTTSSKSPSPSSKATKQQSQDTASGSRPQPKFSSNKVGLAWGADWDRLKNFVVKGAPVYNWTPNPPPADEYGMEPIPMLWGKKNIESSCSNQDRCWSKIKKNGKYKTIMGFNEPNQQGQSDISWQEGVSLWKAHIEPLATGNGAMRTISPATTSAPSGLVWMKNFVKGCTGCHIDVIALHWYDVDADAFIRYVKSFHDAFPDKPIWVTEFACQNMNGGAQCDQNKADNFMRKVTDWMDSVSYVERYFAFGIQHLNNVQSVNQLMDLGSGKPSNHGRIFLGWS